MPYHCPDDVKWKKFGPGYYKSLDLYIIAVLCEDLLEQIPLDQWLQGLSADQRLAGLRPEEIRDLSPEPRAELVRQLSADNGPEEK